MRLALRASLSLWKPLLRGQVSIARPVAAKEFPSAAPPSVTLDRLMQVRRLIVNADDFGLTDGINRAVRDLHQLGALTSTTVMAAAPHFHEAVELSQQQKFPGSRLSHRPCGWNPDCRSDSHSYSARCHIRPP